MNADVIELLEPELARAREGVALASRETGLAVVGHWQRINDELAQATAGGTAASFVADLAAVELDVAPNWRQKEYKVRVAFHEAGHGVLMEEFGWPVESLSIVANAAFHGLARSVLPAGTTRVAPTIREQLEQDVIITLAGPIAENIKSYAQNISPSGESWPGHMAEADEIIARVPGIHEAEIASYMVWLTQRARGEVTRLWWRIAAVGEALSKLRTLSGDEVRRIIADPEHAFAQIIEERLAGNAL